MLLRYERFLLNKGYDTDRLRENAKKRIRVERTLQSVKKKRDLQNQLKTKSDFKEELRKYYNGDSSICDVVQLSDTNRRNDQYEKFKFWDWNYCYAFKNPDAQAKEKPIDVEDAFEQVNNLFKPNEYSNEIEKIRWKSKSFCLKVFHFWSKIN